MRLPDFAIAELEAVADYIARDNPQRAVTFVREIRDKCMSLAAMPLAFPLVPRFERYGVRHRVYGNYQIFYRVRRRSADADRHPSRPARREGLRVDSVLSEREHLIAPGMSEPAHDRVRQNRARCRRRASAASRGKSLARDEAGGHAARHPRQCPDASSSVRCFVSGAHAMDTIIPTSNTPASANIVA
ncbi:MULTISPECIES: type II toxin-antitoxin system RelE/ParE family toxin [unclassified Burkholderia]|uniref:type II toxin-antitoxin system RelE/ParE family toxin n=1 Tax=unclassified Burkholderia TaxID=2613784 RepID=UPI002892F9F6|nr:MULTISPECIES: type II toxin-antitoxin system RelE/ParE family toxin [unclassified Burkholderia]